jgi:putative SOS response-associated peptidase YedK
MCSHYQAETARKKLARMGVEMPLDWEAPPGGLHIYPTLLAPIIRRPPEAESGQAAALGMEVVPARFGMLPVFAKDIQYGKRTYNARSETVSELNSFKHAWANKKGGSNGVPVLARRG